MDGIIPLFKPKGPTSHDCVFKLRKMLGQKKTGHTGTLDPEVEGVLPICIGEGTKVVPFLTGHFKEYIAEMTLGKSTTTEDATGETIEEAFLSSMPSQAEIERVLTTFRKEIIQVPPMYSAVKVNGKKLYEYAREGIHVERPERKAMIQELEYLSKDEKANKIRFRVRCSKGTYIRTLCVDIGRSLGLPAHMSSLIRTLSDGIHLKDTVDFATLEESIQRQTVEQHFLPIDSVLTHFSEIETNVDTAKRVSFGQKLPLPETDTHSDPFKMMHKGRLLAIYEKQESFIQPVRVFNLNKSEAE